MLRSELHCALGCLQVEKRIDTFLTDFRSIIAGLSDVELRTYKEALASQATDVDKRLGAQAGRLWNEIVARRYDYGRPWRSARRLRGVTRENILKFYDTAIAPTSPTSRRMVTHVFSAQAAPSELQVDVVDGDFYPPPEDKYVERIGNMLPSIAA